MRKKFRALLWVLPLVLVLGAAGGYLLVRSRTFQVFGQISSRAETSEKLVALTFDDGPTDRTPAVLQILNELDVKASFSVTGRDLERHPQIGALMVSKGHELGNHSYSHRRMVFRSSSFIRHEVETTNQLIRHAGQQGAVHFRPPYGNKLLLLPWYLKKMRQQTIMWDVDPGRYPEASASAEATARVVVRQTRPGSIILLHVMHQGQDNSLHAIPLIVEQLRQKGYEFVTVSELLPP